jgi:hypothetical protein
LKPFRIRATDNAVELWSGYRIQFAGMMRHDWQHEAKAEFKAALADLVITPDSFFSGYYDTTDPAPVDTENSLFTNLLDEMPRGVRFLRFERGVCDPPEPLEPIHLVGGGHLHYYRYEVGGQWTAWAAERSLATWNRLPRRVPADGSARPSWFALRDANAKGLIEPPADRPAPNFHFGLRVTIHATKNGPRNAISNSESVVDGIIASFHNDRFSEDVFSALALKLPKVDREELRAALDTPIGPLFDTPAIFTKDRFVQISPADERCRVGELVISNDSTSRWPELSGEIFSIRPVRER